MICPPMFIPGFPLSFLNILSVYQLNNCGDKTQSCFTPLVMLIGFFELSLLVSTNAFWLQYIFLINFISFAHIAVSLGFSISFT